jgi:hypothetical protein
MRFISIASIAALTASALVIAAPAPYVLDTRAKSKCTKPAVRKEWRRHTTAYVLRQLQLYLVY